MGEKITIKGENITLELLLHRKYGVRGRGLLNKALNLNPGLAALGPYLPLGTTVVLPDLPAATAPTRRVVTLFG